MPLRLPPSPGASVIRSYKGYTAFAELFTALHKLYCPQLVVELGGGVGFTLQIFAQLPTQRAVCVGYPECELPANVEVYRQDALQPFPSLDNIDILIVDIDNDLNKLLRVYDLWFPKVKENGLIIIEGGHSSWPHAKRGIYDFLNFLQSADEYQVFTVPVYPGMSLVRRNLCLVPGA